MPVDTLIAKVAALFSGGGGSMCMEPCVCRGPERAGHWIACSESGFMSYVCMEACAHIGDMIYSVYNMVGTDCALICVEPVSASCLFVFVDISAGAT